MGLLDFIAEADSPKASPSASLVLYGKESLHIEHRPRVGAHSWRALLESRRFGVAVLGYQEPGESERELLGRLDDAVLRGIRRMRSRLAHERRDLIVTLNFDDELESACTASKGEDVVRIFSDALTASAKTALPWKRYTLLVLFEGMDQEFASLLLDTDSDSGSVAEVPLPQGMAPELLARYERAREAAVKEFGLRLSDDLARAVHSTADNRSLVASKWLRSREIFAVSYGGRRGYFGFQFDPVTGRPKPAIAKIIEAFPANTDGWRLALWFTSANPRLANRRPVDVLDQNPEQVIEAAKGENRGEIF
jgi:hypothetical protein